MPTFAVQYVYDSRTEVRDRVRPEHRAYLAGLVEEGALLASGPYTGPEVGTEQSPDGALLLFRADSVEALDAMLDGDPFVVAGLVAHRTLRPWNPVLGPWA